MKWQSRDVFPRDLYHTCILYIILLLLCICQLYFLSNLLTVSVTCVPWHQMEVEQLLSLSGSALAQAVSSLLETPGLYVFSDILELPNVREVNTLFIFLNLCVFWDLFRPGT